VLRTILIEYEISRNLGVIIGDNATTNDTLCRTIASGTEMSLMFFGTQNKIEFVVFDISSILLFKHSYLQVNLLLFLLRNLQQADREEDEGLKANLVRAATIRFIGPMGKLHNIVVHIRGSGLRTKEFIDKAQRMVPLGNRTRWNSRYYMITIALELEMHIDSYVRKQEDLKEDALNRADWDMHRTIRVFLKYFKDIVLENEGDSKTLGHSLPLMLLIRTHIMAFQTKHERDNTEFARDCVVRAKATFVAFQKWWDVLWKHPLYHISTVLHPFYPMKFLNKAIQALRISTNNHRTKKEWVKQVWLDWKEDQESYEETSTSKSTHQLKSKEDRQRKGDMAKKRGERGVRLPRLFVKHKIVLLRVKWKERLVIGGMK
jgi:hypothetical protein